MFEVEPLGEERPECGLCGGITLFRGGAVSGADVFVGSVPLRMISDEKVNKLLGDGPIMLGVGDDGAEVWSDRFRRVAVECLEELK